MIGGTFRPAKVLVDDGWIKIGGLGGSVRVRYGRQLVDIILGPSTSLPAPWCTKPVTRVLCVLRLSTAPPSRAVERALRSDHADRMLIGCFFLFVFFG